MFEPMLRCKITNRVYIFSNDFETDGCTGCAFQDDPIGCANTPDICREEDGIWIPINLVAE